MIKILNLLICFLLFSAGTNLHLLSQETLPDTVWTKDLWPDDIVKAKFSLDGNVIIVATTNKIILYNTLSGEKIKETDFLQYSFGSQAFDMELSPINRNIAVSSANGRIVIMNQDNLDTIKTIYLEKMVLDIEYNPTGDRIYIVTDAGDFINKKNILIYDVLSNNIINSIGDDGGTIKIVFSKSNLFATYSLVGVGWGGGEQKHNIKLWDENTLKEVCTLGSHDAFVEDLNFSPDGKYLASGGMDTIVKIWAIQNRKLFKEFKIEVTYDVYKFASEIANLKFSPNSEYIVVGNLLSDLSKTYIWILNEDKMIKDYDYASTGNLDISNNNYIIASNPSNLYLLNAKWTGTSVPNEPVVETVVYPNPNSGNANIEIVLDKSQFVNVEILDISGNTIQSLFSGMLNQGINNLIWETKNIPSGTYFCKINGSSFNKSIKIIVNK